MITVGSAGQVMWSPPELEGDCADRGIVHTGSVALLRSYDTLLCEET